LRDEGEQPMFDLFASLSFRLWLNINRRQSPREDEADRL
jgi:hypothetical protein